MSNPFSFARFIGILIKEFLHIRRDRPTFAVIFFLPLVQLVLFGYAINFDPKGLPTAVVATEENVYTRSLVSALRNSSYFDLTHAFVSEGEAEQLIRRGEVQFVVSFPSDFSRNLLRGDRPALLLQADATDTATITPALGVLTNLLQDALAHDFTGPLASQGNSLPFEVVIHRLYNPENITAFSIVPGLTGTVLTLTMIMIAATTLTRELEWGTMENLLAMPVNPLEVMLGKIIPFLLIGCVQTAVIILAAYLFFHVPIEGSLGLLAISTIFFTLANLAVGFTISTFASNQVQASQLSTFFFLPSLLLSGFAFPFRGMPYWAQIIGELLPLTHFLRIVRGILLKGITLSEVWPHFWPILLFMAIALIIARQRYRMTLD